MMRKIGGSGFKSEEKIEMKIDRFEEMVTEVDRIGLVNNFRYAMSLQFLERLEKCGDINAVERMKLKDVIEDVNSNPKEGNTFEMMKKVLKKMKVDENCEEPFTKENNTYYVQNTDDKMSRKDRWSSKKFIRSDSRPEYFMTASKKSYMRGN